MYDIIVIGGGASGLISAIAAKRKDQTLSVAIIERFDRVGKKLSTTGNGQCNITNKNPSKEFYHGDSSFAEKVIGKFTPNEQKEFFGSVGLPFFFREDNKAYPYSLQATSVVDALRFAADECGVETVTENAVTDIRKDGETFTVISQKGKYSAKAVIIACGGIVGGKLGSNDGYAFLKSFSHRITPLKPAIVQLKSDLNFLRSVKGIKVPAKLKAGNVSTEAGDLLFTDYGISGPAVLTLSSYYKEGSNFTVFADLLPLISAEESLEILINKRNNQPTRNSDELLSGLIHKKLGMTVVKQVGIELARPIGDLSDKELDAVNEMLHGLKINITGTNGMANAQVTSGGAVTDEFNPLTLESNKVKGLFAAGEVLNVDGNCGGYNLCFAWASGHLAGTSAAEYIK